MADENSQYIEKNPLKIINPGWYKCGSKSLSIALQELGFSTCHDLTDSMDLLTKKRNWFTSNENILERIHTNDNTLNYDDWLTEMSVNAIMDFPVVFIWKDIFERYPNSKVILLVRNENEIEQWIKSYLNLLKQINRFHIVYRMINTLVTIKTFVFEMNVWNKYHYGNLSQFLSLSEMDKNIALRQKYHEHIENVKKRVPSNQLLIMNIRDGWKPLCGFLDKPIPNKAFPNVNSTKEFNKTSRRDLLLLTVSILVPLVGTVAVASWGLYKWKSSSK